MTKEERERLVEHAARAREGAYAPYSGYRVGAALRGADGTIHPGCNVENASYGLALCAERLAMASAVAAGARAFDAIAILTQSSPPAPPCGMCLQTLAEFAEDLEVILANDQGERRVVRLAELLPLGFRRRDLTR